MEQNKDKQRRWLPVSGDMCDRLVIAQLKELKIKNHREEYTKEIDDILHDLDMVLEEKPVKVTANLIRDIIVLAIMNDEIWFNESNYRNGITEGNNLGLTHGLNTTRCISRRRIQNQLDNESRKQYKVDSVKCHPDWVPSGYEHEE